MPDQVIRVTNGSSLVVRSGAILGVGPSGPIGPQGATGPPGPQGSYIYFTPTPPDQVNYPVPPGPPRSGDSWVDPATGNISHYDQTTGNWTTDQPPISIKGPQGIQGIVGPQGQQGIEGPPGSASSGFNTFDDLLPPGDRHPPE